MGSEEERACLRYAVTRRRMNHELRLDLAKKMVAASCYGLWQVRLYTVGASHLLYHMGERYISDNKNNDFFFDVLQ